MTLLTKYVIQSWLLTDWVHTLLCVCGSYRWNTRWFLSDEQLANSRLSFVSALNEQEVKSQEVRAEFKIELNQPYNLCPVN